MPRIRFVQLSIRVNLSALLLKNGSQIEPFDQCGGRAVIISFPDFSSARARAMRRCLNMLLRHRCGRLQRAGGAATAYRRSRHFERK
jgi:hypothetical protein